MTNLIKSINNSERQGSPPFQGAYPTLDYLTTIFDLDKELKMNQEEGTIYIATNLINGKQYVGQTIRAFETRLKEHHRKNDSVLLYRAIKKYTTKNFKWIFFSCPIKDLDWTESSLIKELNTLAPNGYNIEGGGNKNKIVTELTKRKMKKNHADFSGKNHPQYGTHTSEETKENKKKYCLKKYGVVHPMKTITLKEKASSIRKKWWNENPEARKKLAERNENSGERLKKHRKEHPEIWEQAREKTKKLFKEHPELWKRSK